MRSKKASAGGIEGFGGDANVDEEAVGLRVQCKNGYPISIFELVNYFKNRLEG